MHEPVAQAIARRPVSEPNTPTASSQETTVITSAITTTSVGATGNRAMPVQSADVVSQIAHQADLLRLPGNRGVRVNLVPEGLGGVQVTLRYAPGGGLELHISVEHASTGTLVQAGWAQLRDALATQGITPDRLVLSVTGPPSATQTDLSFSNGSSYRSDAALTAFGQGGHSGQQRGSGGEGRTGVGWNPVSNRHADEPSDTAAPPAPNDHASRIDYRV
jgi:hypothetical protein